MWAPLEITGEETYYEIYCEKFREIVSMALTPLGCYRHFISESQRGAFATDDIYPTDRGCIYGG